MMTKKIIKTLAVLVMITNTNVYSQKISKEEKKQKKIEKKQKKIEKKIFFEKINDTLPLNSQGEEVSVIPSNACLNNLVKLTYISKSNKYSQDIILFNKLDLHKRIKFYDIYKSSNNLYIHKEGFGKSYPNQKDTDEFIKCKKLVNIYNFREEEIKYGSCVSSSNFTPVDYLVLEYEKNTKDNQIGYVVIKKSEFENRIKILKKSEKLHEEINKTEFIISYNTASAFSSDCFNKLVLRKDFYIIKTDTLQKNLRQEAEKLTIDWMKNRYFYDTPAYYEKEFKSQATNLSSGTWTNIFDRYGRYIGTSEFDYIDFTLDTIKFYQLDVVALINSGLLKDSLKSYGQRDFKTTNYRDLWERITGDDVENKNVLDSYTSKEVEKMSTIEYWEKNVPKNNDLKKFITESYVIISPRIYVQNYLNDENSNTLFDFSEISFNNELDYSNAKNKIRLNFSSSFNNNESTKDEDKYFYTSTEINTLRFDVINLLADAFCKKSGIMNSEKKKKEKEQEYLNTLSKEFGKKYAQAAVNGDIIVGMPEKLLQIPLRVWNIKSSAEWKKGYRIYCTFKFNSSKKLIVYVYDGKVASISNW